VTGLYVTLEGVCTGLWLCAFKSDAGAWYWQILELQMEMEASLPCGAVLFTGYGGREGKAADFPGLFDWESTSMYGPSF